METRCKCQSNTKAYTSYVGQMLTCVLSVYLNSVIFPLDPDSPHSTIGMSTVCKQTLNLDPLPIIEIATPHH